jgi:hypothetical protein
MKKKIAELNKKRLTVELQFEPYGLSQIHVVCILKRQYFKHLAVRSFDLSFEGAVERAEALLEKLVELEKKLGKPLEAPPLESQKFEGGYTRKKVAREGDANIEVEYRRKGNEFVVTRIYLVDDHGFYIEPEPQDVTSDLTPSQQEIEGLTEGQSLYEWNDIGYLSGSAGLAIVEKGKVVKTKTTMIS